MTIQPDSPLDLDPSHFERLIQGLLPAHWRMSQIEKWKKRAALLALALPARVRRRLMLQRQVIFCLRLLLLVQLAESATTDRSCSFQRRQIPSPELWSHLFETVSM